MKRSRTGHRRPTNAGLGWAPLAGIAFFIPVLLLFALDGQSRGASRDSSSIANPPVIQSPQPSNPTPPASPTSSATQGKPVVLDGDGVVYFEGRPIADESELVLELHQMAASGVREIEIQGNLRTPLGAVIEAIKLCKDAGLKATPALRKMPPIPPATNTPLNSSPPTGGQ